MPPSPIISKELLRPDPETSVPSLLPSTADNRPTPSMLEACVVVVCGTGVIPALQNTPQLATLETVWSNPTLDPWVVFHRFSIQNQLLEPLWERIQQPVPLQQQHPANSCVRRSVSGLGVMNPAIPIFRNLSQALCWRMFQAFDRPWTRVLSNDVGSTNTSSSLGSNVTPALATPATRMRHRY